MMQLNFENDKNIAYLQNQNLLYAWLENMQNKIKKIPTALLGPDEDTQCRKALWLIGFVLKDVMKLTEEEAVNTPGLLEKIKMSYVVKRPIIFVPLLNAEHDRIKLCASKGNLLELYERYIIRYAFRMNNPEKMLDLYYLLYDEPQIRSINGRKDNIMKSIKFIEKLGVSRA